MQFSWRRQVYDTASAIGVYALPRQFFSLSTHVRTDVILRLTEFVQQYSVYPNRRRTDENFSGPDLHNVFSTMYR